MEEDEAIDRWFEFVKKYNSQSSVPLSYALLPNPTTTGFRTTGSPMGFCKLSKQEWNNLMRRKK